MSALIKACNKALSIKNTGSDCDESMGPTAMLFAVPPSVKWTESDLLDFAAYLLTQIHAAKGLRIYPLFGPAAPIRKVTNNKEADVIATMDDGTQIFIRYGVLNRAFATTEGGLCFAQALQSLTKAGYSIIEVDNANQVMFRKNSDATYSALKTTFMFSPSPDLADFKNPFYSNFQASIKPEEYLGNGVIFQAQDTNITDLLGLLDSDLFDATGSSTTKLKFGAKTDCSDTDLVAEFGAALAMLTNFIVKKVSDGSSPSVTAAAVVGGHIELTGTFVSGSAYSITGAAPSVLLGNDVQGIEFIKPLIITIP